jgi:hypothetical protein
MRGIDLIGARSTRNSKWQESATFDDSGKEATKSKSSHSMRSLTWAGIDTTEKVFGESRKPKSLKAPRRSGRSRSPQKSEAVSSSGGREIRNPRRERSILRTDRSDSAKSSTRKASIRERDANEKQVLSNRTPLDDSAGVELVVMPRGQDGKKYTKILTPRESGRRLKTSNARREFSKTLGVEKRKTIVSAKPKVLTQPPSITQAEVVRKETTHSYAQAPFNADAEGYKGVTAGVEAGSMNVSDDADMPVTEGIETEVEVVAMPVRWRN